MTENIATIGHNSKDNESELHLNYFNTDFAIQVHDFIIEQSGGLMGIKDAGMVDSILAHVQNNIYYPEFLDKITHLVYSFIKNHAFIDGNKRSSIALSAFFLEINGYDFTLHQYQHGMEEVVIWVAKNLIDKNTLKDIIEFLISDTPENVTWFIVQSKTFQPFIEPPDQPITANLLQQMVYDWIGLEGLLSENTLLQLLDVLPSPD